MKRKIFLFLFVVATSFMFSSCLGLYLLRGILYGYGTRNPGEGRPVSTAPSTTAPSTTTPSTTTPSTTTPNTDSNTSAPSATNASDTTVVMEAWSNEYHYIFYKGGTVSIMDFNDKELSRTKYTASSNTITINGEKFRFEDQSDNFESVPHKIGTLVKI